MPGTQRNRSRGGARVSGECARVRATRKRGPVSRLWGSTPCETRAFAMPDKPINPLRQRPSALDPKAIRDRHSPSTKCRRLQSRPHFSKPLEVWINDLYEKDGHLLVRYTVFNSGNHTYSVAPPRVFQLNGVRSAQSLYGLANSQLSEDQANKLKIKHRIPVKVVEQELPSHSIAPGLSTTGIVSLEMASSSEPIVLSFQFSGRNNAGDQPTRPVTAYLVR